MERFAAPQPKKRIKKEPVSVTNHEVAAKKASVARDSEEINGPLGNKDYVCVGADTVSVIAESIGIPNLGDDIAASLAEDVSYRLQEIINTSSTCMRKSKRRKLITSDVTSAFQTSNVHHIFGHSQKEAFNFLRLPDGEIYLPEDPELDLISQARSNNVPRIKKPSYIATSYPVLKRIHAPPVNGYALKTEGNHYPFHSLKPGVVNGDIKAEASKSFKETYHYANKSLVQESVLLDEKRSPNSNGHQFKPALGSRSKLNGCVKFASHYGVREKLKRDTEEEFHLSKAQLSYFNVLAKCIIEGHHILFQQALSSLRHSRKAETISAPLLNFVALSVCHIPRHFGFIMRLLETVDVLLCNKNTSPIHSIAVNRIVNALLAIIADQNVLRSKNDFLLRRKAAQLLTRVLLVWGIEEQHVAELLSRAARILGDNKEKIQSHYGALVIFQSLGKAAIGWLSPLLKCFIPLLEKRYPSTSKNSNIWLEEIRGVLLDIVELLFCDANSNHFKVKATTIQEVQAAVQLDALLYHYCGDAVCARRRPLQYNPQEAQRRPSFGDKDLQCRSDIKPRQHMSKHLNWRYISHYPQKPRQNHQDSTALTEAWVVPVVVRRKDIQFKFAGANPVPKNVLRKKVLDKTHVQFNHISTNQLNTTFPRQHLLVGRLHQSKRKGSINQSILPNSLLNVL